METVILEIPIRKIPRLATAAILSGDDLGAWFVKGIEESPLSSTIHGEEVIIPESSVVLDSLPETQPEPEEAPVGDFFADLI